MHRKITIIAHNIRSTHNVGALLRTCDGIGVAKLYFSGYTPFPKMPNNDPRLPYLAEKIDKQIRKTALGAEKSTSWEHAEDVQEVFGRLFSEGYTLSVLEQSNTSQPLPSFTAPEKIALLLGSEVEGVNKEILKQIPLHLEIPMFGSKESFNVIEAASMALYHLRFTEETSKTQKQSSK